MRNDHITLFTDRSFLPLVCAFTPRARTGPAEWHPRVVRELDPVVGLPHLDRVLRQQYVRQGVELLLRRLLPPVDTLAPHFSKSQSTDEWFTVSLVRVGGWRGKETTVTSFPEVTVEGRELFGSTPYGTGTLLRVVTRTIRTASGSPKPKTGSKTGLDMDRNKDPTLKTFG